ncbi:MAG: cytochrome c biogenesis protein DipZ [Candidatus Roizmanbacteria bacterium]|nr:cytochrome c biogenesis protein DipZ [Candidatus Roizmanbacteria bacterium]
MTTLLLFAFLSGLVTIAAPCIWPILPIVLSSSATGGHRRPLGVTLGVVISFSILTLSIAYVVRIIPFDTEWLRYISVGIIAVLGLTLIIPAFGAYLEGAVSKLSSKFSPSSGSGNSGFRGGLLTGLSLGVVWTPCAGPILATIATLAATRAVSFDLILVMIVYMLGVAIPLFVFSLFGQRLFNSSRKLSRHTGTIQKVFGVIMIVTAILIATGYDRNLQTNLLNAFPSYSSFLTKLETNDGVTKQLDTLRNNPQKETSIEVAPTMAFPQAKDTSLPYIGQAPDFTGIEHWLNSEALTMDDLKGKVVLIDFWTYTCINCIRTLPYVTGWYEKYKDEGFVVIGVHTPEFEFEKKTENVAGALEKYKINYPVAQDNDFGTWRAYDNHYWPAKYLVDAEGIIRYTHFGEGDYDVTEKNIQKLLKEAGLNKEQDGATDLDSLLDIPETRSAGDQTPETYLGLSRMTGFASPERATNGNNSFTLPKSLPVNKFAFVGNWNLSSESAKVGESGAGLLFNFFAKDVYLVITPVSSEDQIAVFVNDEVVTKNAGKDVENGFITIDEPRLYHVVSFDEKQEAILQLNFQTPGTEVFAFTFGG